MPGMNNQDTLRNLLIAAIVFVLLMAVGNVFLQSRHKPEVSTPIAGEPGSAVPDEMTDAQRETPADRPSGQQREPETADTSQVFTVSEAEEEQTLSLGSAAANGIETKPEESPYRMRLLLSNVGASIDSAMITDHAEELHSAKRYQLLKPMERPDGAIDRSLVVEKLQIDGSGVRLSDKKWHVALAEESRTGPAEVRFWIDVLEAGRGVVRVTHTFSLPQQDRKLGRHDLRSDLSIENLSDEPHNVLIAYRGGLGIRRVNPRFPDEFVDWGLWDGQRVNGKRKKHTAISKSAGELVLLYRPTPDDPKARLSWAATANTYFTCTIAPLNRDGTDNAGYLADVSALDADGSPTTQEDVTLKFVTTNEVLPAGQTLDYPAAVYIGEKEGNAFREISEYRNRNYYFQISKGFGFCTFTWLVEVMIWLINGLTWITHDFGVAIIILVLIVRTLLHPITKKGQVNMVRMQHKMQTLAPKIEEIKKKYANDKALMNQEMMKLNINPAGQMITCLPMMIQMPIWVALYISLSNNILMRHEPFLFTWIHDLTAPDALYTFRAPIHVPLFGWELSTFNLLPLLVSVFMYTQQKLQPKPKPNPNASDQQRQQQEMMQKMMPMMSIMMLLIFYKMPSGLNLYIMSSSLFGTIEQWRIRAHIKEREADGTLHKPAKKTNKPEPFSKPRKPGFFAKLQKMAEEAQKDKLRRYGKTKKGR